MKQSIIALIFLSTIWQDRVNILLKTSKGDQIKISGETIYYNQKVIGRTNAEIVPASDYNRLIEQNGKILLFLETDERPNYNKLEVLSLTKTHCKKLIACVYNDKKQGTGPKPFTDIDNDGKLEFGGFDMTEKFPANDSAYYSPSKFYEIDNGTIILDSSLTREMDIKVNGQYIPRPLDKKGHCCIVIKKKSNR